MNPITDGRKEIAEYINTLAPDIPIFSYPPSNVSAPCIVITFRESTQKTSGLWHQIFRVSVIGPAGDNDAAITSLEEMIWLIASSVSHHYSTKVEWRVPNTLTANGQVYLMTSFDMAYDIS